MPRAGLDGVVRVKQEDIARREDGAMPVELEAFLMVGRKTSKTEGGRTVDGVIRMWSPTFGAGQQHDGLRVCYHPNKLKGERPEDAKPMNTKFSFYVAWEGESELEEMSLEEAQAVATQEWNEDFMPEAIRRLVKGGPDGGFNWALWDKLDGAKAAQIHLAEGEVAERKERAKRQSAATRAEKKRGSAAPRAAPRARAKRTGGAPGGAAAARQSAAAKKAAELAPLRAPEGVADAFQAKAAAKRKRQEAARAAAAAAAAAGEPVAPSPAKRYRILGDLAPVPCASPQAPLAAAAAARVVPSGQGSPSSRAAPSRRKPQQPTTVASDSVADSSSRQRRQQEAQQQQQEQQQRRQQQARPASAGRQTLLSPSKSGKSRGSGRSTGGKAALPAVLQQHEQKPVAPADSVRLRRADPQSDKVEFTQQDEVFWYERVLTEDGRLFRAYSQHLILLEPACLKSRDKRLRSWKGKVQNDVDYGVEALLAEREGEDGEPRYLVKWTGFEADPAEDSWLEEGALADSQATLDAWKSRGKEEWQAASRAVLAEAGVEHT